MSDQASEQCQPWTYVPPKERTGSLAKKYEGNPQALLEQLGKQLRGKRLNLVLSALADTGWPVPEQYSRPVTAGAPDRQPPYRPDWLAAPLEGTHWLQLAGSQRQRVWTGKVLRILGPISPNPGEDARSGEWCAQYETLDRGPQHFMRDKEIAVRADSAEECARRLQVFLRKLGHQIEVRPRYPLAPYTDRAESGSARAAQRLRRFHETYPAIYHPEKHRLNLGWHRTLTVSISSARLYCMGCGHTIEDWLSRTPAYVYFFRDDARSPRTVACWKCWHAAGLPDLGQYSQQLAEMYRDWHVLIGQEPPMDRRDPLTAAHYVDARDLVLGGSRETEGVSFRRFCRLRLCGYTYKMLDGQFCNLSYRDRLEGVTEAYNRGFDSPVLKSWACLKPSPPKVDRPEGMQDWWRVGGLDDRVGFSLGYNAYDEVLLRFEDGSVDAFSPHQIFPLGENLKGKELDLAYLYRDWISATIGGVSAYPSEETLAKYQGWAAELVIGGEREKEGAQFRRFCRVRLEGRQWGFDLATAAEAFRNKVDYSPIEGWDCLEESDEHFLNQSWESGRTPSRPCVRCGQSPGEEEEGWIWFCGTKNYLCPSCQADVLAWADQRRETYKQEAAENDRAMRKAKARARETANLPDGVPETVEVDLGRAKGWAVADVVKVKEPWLYYRLPDEEKPRKVKLIGEDILWRKPPMQM